MDGGVSALILFLTIVAVLAVGIFAAYGLVVGIFSVLSFQSRANSEPVQVPVPVLFSSHSEAGGD